MYLSIPFQRLSIDRQNTVDSGKDQVAGNRDFDPILNFKVCRNCKAESFVRSSSANATLPKCRGD